MKLFALTVAGCLLAGQAGAAVYRYDFLYTISREEGDETVPGVLIVDEGRYPGGSVADTALFFAAGMLAPPWLPETRLTISGAVSYQDGFFGGNPADALAAVGVSSSPVAAYYPPAYSNTFAMAFDSFANLVSLWGSETTGGSGDYSYGGLDGVVRTELPAPVPVPAAVTMLMTGMAGLFGLTRRSRRSFPG